MKIQEWSEYIAEIMLRKAVQYWAKKNPKSLDMHTHTHANGKRYLIHIRRGDFKEYTEEGEKK